MSDDRFAVDLTELSDTIPLLPNGSTWQARISKAESKVGVSDKGNFWGSLSIFCTIKGQEAAKLLNRDDPRIFHQVFVSFEKDDKVGWKLSKTNNPELKALLKSLDLLGENFLEGCEGEFEQVWGQYLTNIANVLVGYDVTIKVNQVKDRQDASKMRNVIVNFAKAD